MTSDHRDRDVSPDTDTDTIEASTRSRGHPGGDTKAAHKNNVSAILAYLDLDGAEIDAILERTPPCAPAAVSSRETSQPAVPAVPALEEAPPTATDDAPGSNLAACE